MSASKKEENPWAINSEKTSNYSNERLTFFEKIVNILFHPKEFFEWLSKNHSTKESVKYFLLLNYVISGILLIFGAIAIFFLMSSIRALFNFIPSFSSLILIGILFFILAILPLFSLLLMLMGSVLFHLFIIIFKGKDFSKTFSVFVYSTTTSLIFSILLTIFYILSIFIPLTFIIVTIISVPLSLWSLVLGFYGIMKVHEFSFLKTLSVYLICLSIITIIILIPLLLFVL